MSERRPATTTFSVHAHKKGKKNNFKIEVYDARLWAKNIRLNPKKVHPHGLYFLNPEYSGMFRLRINGVWKRQDDKQYSFYSPAFIRQFVSTTLNILTFNN